MANKVGRPPFESSKIDKQDLEKLLLIYMSVEEAANWFDVSVMTLTRFIKRHYKCNFVEFRDKRFVRTRVSIKRKQIEKALTGDNTMLIWVGKQYLDQKDQQESVVHQEEQVTYKLNWADENDREDPKT